jgi:hypothetical protein
VIACSTNLYRLKTRLRNYYKVNQLCCGYNRALLCLPNTLLNVPMAVEAPQPLLARRSLLGDLDQLAERMEGVSYEVKVLEDWARTR